MKNLITIFTFLTLGAIFNTAYSWDESIDHMCGILNDVRTPTYERSDRAKYIISLRFKSSPEHGIKAILTKDTDEEIGISPLLISRIDKVVCIDYRTEKEFYIVGTSIQERTGENLNGYLTWKRFI